MTSEIPVTFGMIAFICVCTFLGGFIDSIAGGGGLISVPAYMATGIPAHMALGSNKLSAVAGTLFSSANFIKNKKYEIKSAIASTIFAVIGSSIGTRIALRINEQAFKKAFIFIIPVIAVLILVKKDFGSEEETVLPPTKRLVTIASLIGLGIGFYDGLIGPGTGTFLIIAYSVFLKFSLVDASGNAKITNLASGLASTVTFLINGKILFALAIPGAIFGILGNVIGSSLAIKNGSKIIKPILVLVLTGLLIKMAWDLQLIKL